MQAIRAGDVAAVREIVAREPGLANARLVGDRTALHVVTDWPGYFPEGPATVRALIDAGADPDGGVDPERPRETPLHWAASSDDVEVAEALLDGGAASDPGGGSIDGATPLHNAVGYGCWHVARLLVARGARVDALWVAAGLGLRDRVDELLAADPPTGRDDLDTAFWAACHGGQRRTAEHLLARGADLNRVPDFTDQSPLDAAGGLDTRRGTLVDWLRERGARPARPAG